MTNSSQKLDLILQVQTRLMETDFDLASFMDLVVEDMLELTPATGAVIELHEKDEMVYRAATGSIKDYIGLRLPSENSISGLCVKSREVLRSNDTEKDERVNLEACRKVGARSMVVAPLFHDGKTVGVLKIISNQPNAFNEEDVKTLQLMAGFVASGLSQQIMKEFKSFF